MINHEKSNLDSRDDSACAVAAPPPHSPTTWIGISFRSKWRTDVLANRERIGCLEIIAEHYVDAPPEKMAELDEIRSGLPILPHGIGLSFGTDAPLDETHLNKIARLIERVQPPWFTEHIAFTHVHGWHVGHLAPLPFTHESVRAICRNVKQWHVTTGVPLMLENITYMVAMPGELSEAQFLTEVTERADCGLLLDLHNVYTNALNHGYDPLEFLESLPLHRVGQVHLGGGHEEEDGFRIDSHSAPTPEPVWDLLASIAERPALKAAIIEWDTDLPPFEVMLREVERARSILRGEFVGAS